MWWRQLVSLNPVVLFWFHLVLVICFILFLTDHVLRFRGLNNFIRVWKYCYALILESVMKICRSYGLYMQDICLYVIQISSAKLLSWPLHSSFGVLRCMDILTINVVKLIIFYDLCCQIKSFSVPMKNDFLYCHLNILKFDLRCCW